jgi:putative ABC transport system permease protein
MVNLIVENIKQRPLRTAISVVGVALGVVLIVLMVGLAHGMTRDSAERQSHVDAEIRFLPTEINSASASNPLLMREEYADAILKGVKPTAEDPDITLKPPITGVIAASPVGEFVKDSTGGIGFEVVDGVDYESFTQVSSLRIVEGRGLGKGDTPETQYEVIVDRYYAERNTDIDEKPIRVGSKMLIFSHQFTVVGIYDPPLLGRIKIPLRTMQELLGGAKNCSFILVRTERPEMAKQAKEELERLYPGYHAYLREEIPALFSQNLRAVDIFLDVVIWLAVVISTLVILLAMYTTILERTREIGILKSLGASKSFIILTIEQEAAFISLLGVLFGFVVAVIGKVVLEKTSRLTIDIEPRWLLIAGVIGIVCGMIGALYPATRAANLDVIEAISYE